MTNKSLKGFNMINYLNKVSEFFIEDTSENTNYTVTMYDLYHEIALENYNKYSLSSNELYEVIRLAETQFNELFNSINENNVDMTKLTEDLSDYMELLRSDISSNILIANHQDDAVAINNIIWSFAIKTDEYNKFKKLDISKYNSSFMNALKFGMSAIAFEAFACEALINQKLLEFITKSQLDKLKKTKSPAYLEKIKLIVEYTNCNEDYSELNNKISALMNARNNIAHYKEFKFDFIEIFKLLSKFDFQAEDDFNINYFYIGEAFFILNNNFDVFEKLKGLIQN